MTITPESLRADLAGLGERSAHAAAVDNDLTRAAGERRHWLDARIESLRPTALTVEADGEEYQRLVGERGQLDVSFPA
jgi:hypothetical protein